MQIRSLQYRIQHLSIPLSEEKQILREIKQLEGTREKVMANAAMIAKIQESMGKKEVIQDQVKVRYFKFVVLLKPIVSLTLRLVNLLFCYHQTGTNVLVLFHCSSWVVI